MKPNSVSLTDFFSRAYTRPLTPVSVVGGMLLLLFFVVLPSTAQRISDVHGHAARDGAYQSSAPIDRLAMISSWVADRRTSQDAVRLLVRREATTFLKQQAMQASASSGLTHDQAAALHGQARPGAGTFGARGVPSQRLAAEQMKARRDMQQVTRDAAVQREFGGRLIGWYMLQGFAIRGGPLEELEIPGDLMDEVCMRMVFGDIRWTDPSSTPQVRLALLEEIRRNKLWSPMLDHLASAEIAQLLHREASKVAAADRPVALLMLLRTYKKKEMINWGPFHQQTEERLLLDYMESPDVLTSRDPKAKLIHLRRLEAEQLISNITRNKFEIPYALEYLQRNPGFMASSTDGKRQFIRQMRTERMIDFLSVRTLEVAFGVR